MLAAPRNERRYSMDGETNGSQEATQGAENQAQQQGQEQQETQQSQSQIDASNYEKQIAELKAQGESDRIDFKLQLAGVRNVKAARALLSDHGNDVDKLKEAEPWLFEASGKHAKGGSSGGTTRLPNAGAASDDGKTLKHWREVAGLTDEDDKKEE